MNRDVWFTNIAIRYMVHHRSFLFSTRLSGKSQWPRFEPIQGLPVSSNDLVYDEHGVSTGEVEISVSGSFGKHQKFLDLVATVRERADDIQHAPGSTRRSLTVYVGDNETDLLAMLDADVGIVIGHSDSFAKVASAFGVSVCPLASAYGELERRGASQAAERGSAEPECRVFCVERWAEIDVFLFGDNSE